MIIPKTVVFDLGKVLVDFDYAIAVGKIVSRARMPIGELAHFINHSPLFSRYETGLLTSEEFYREICAATGFHGTFEQFGSYFADIFTEIGPMVQLHGTLCQEGIPTYAFSNTNDLAVRHIRRSFPFFTAFTGCILSYEHKAMKPDSRLYEVVERESGRRGPDILYFDDRPENVAAGAARGWQAILHESPEASLAVVEKLGLLNHST
jgi:FMN phosphatase YigB (HAD superfamily)